jgi:hypothetical protein
MKKLAAVVIVGLAAREAVASPCHGDSSSSSSSSSGDDGSSMFSSSGEDDAPGTAATPIDWAALPGISIELGVSTFELTSPLSARTGSVTHGTDTFSYRVIAPQQRDKDTAVVGTLRIGVGLSRSLYAGAEANLGALSGGRVAAEMMSTTERGAPNLEANGVGVAGVLGVVGARTQLGRVELGLEAAGGFRSLIYQYESHYLACETTTSIVESMPALEARARAAVWIAPHVQLGASAGKSLLDDSWITGIHVGATTHAFGGR